MEAVTVGNRNKGNGGGGGKGSGGNKDNGGNKNGGGHRKQSGSIMVDGEVEAEECSTYIVIWQDSAIIWHLF